MEEKSFPLPFFYMIKSFVIAWKTQENVLYQLSDLGSPFRASCQRTLPDTFNAYCLEMCIEAA